MDKIPSHVAKLQSLTLASDMHASEGGIVGKDYKPPPQGIEAHFAQ
jgi:hypothetical protein